MKVALWLALSQILQGVVDGFTGPQQASHARYAWTSQSIGRVPILFAQEEPDKESDRPKVPVPPSLDPNVDEFLAQTDEELEAQRPRVVVQQTKPKMPLSADQEISVVASGIGGAFLGLVSGAILIAAFPDLDVVMEPLVWPLATSIVFAVAGFVGGSSEGQVGETFRGSLGKATRAVGSAIKVAVAGAASALAESVQNKLKETADEIKSLPSKVADAAKEKLEDTVEEISQIPTKVKQRAIETAEGVTQQAIAKTEEIVSEIKATPGRVVESSKKALEDVVDDTLDAVEKAVEDVASIPKKAVASVEEKVNIFVGNNKPEIPATPQPPKSPPPIAESAPEKPKPPPTLTDISKPSIPKLEVPKFDLPKVEPPKLDLPKIEAPKLDLLKVELPKPDVPKAKPSKIEVPKLELPKVGLPKFGAQESAEAKSPAAAETKSAQSEIFEIQAAVKRATEEARKEVSEKKKALDESASDISAAAEASAAEKAKAQAAERKEAAARRKEAAAKAAEAQRQKEDDMAKRKAEKEAAAEEARKKREAAAAESTARLEVLKQKQARAAEKSLESAKPRRTISLGDLFNIGKSDETASPQKVPLTAKAPPGVPTINNWKQNADGSITGKISGSTSFKDGESITTSPVPAGASSGAVVRTNSGSRYFLAQTGGFSFGLPTPSLSLPKVAVPSARPSEPVPSPSEKSAEARRAVKERKAAQAAAVEERRRAVEENKAAQSAAAEERRKAAEESKAAQAAAADKARKAAAEKQAQQAARAEEMRKAAEEKKAAIAAAAEEKRRLAEEKKAAQAAAASKRQAAGKNTAPTAVPKAAKPPRGVPEIRAWKKRPDGGVSGKIFGSPNFTDGDFVETSAITRGSIEDGSLVSTASGSRYFLSAEPAVKKANIAAAIKDMAGAKPGATITLTRERKQREAEAAMEAVKSAKPRATFSLFGLGFGDADEGLPKESAEKAKPQLSRPISKQAPRPSRPIQQKEAPRGVPTMSRWKKNFDGSITGIISGSRTFSDGDRVTTSPIAKGKIASGEVVITGSGSKYFLS